MSSSHLEFIWSRTNYNLGKESRRDPQFRKRQNVKYYLRSSNFRAKSLILLQVEVFNFERVSQLLLCQVQSMFRKHVFKCIQESSIDIFLQSRHVPESEPLLDLETFVLMWINEITNHEQNGKKNSKRMWRRRDFIERYGLNLLVVEETKKKDVRLDKTSLFSVNQRGEYR